MNIEIKTPIRNINVNMTQGNIKKLLDFAYENAVIENNDSDINKQETVPKESEENSRGYSNGRSYPEKRIMHGEKKEYPPRPHINGHRCFLLIKCNKCGKIKGFCAKEPTTEFWCTCGEKSELPERLTQAILRCECGSIWKYRTNATDDVIEYNCISCGAPVDMQYNQKRNRYETIN